MSQMHHTVSCRYNAVEYIMLFHTALQQQQNRNLLTHWDRVTHIYVSKLTTIGSDNGLSPARRQAIIWTNAGLLLIGPLGTNFRQISIRIQTFLFKKKHLKMSSGKWRPCCLGLNVLTQKDAPYLTIMCELWAIYCGNFGENWRYNGSALYQIKQQQDIETNSQHSSRDKEAV